MTSLAWYFSLAISALLLMGCEVEDKRTLNFGEMDPGSGATNAENRADDDSSPDADSQSKGGDATPSTGSNPGGSASSNSDKNSGSSNSEDDDDQEDGVVDIDDVDDSIDSDDPSQSPSQSKESAKDKNLRNCIYFNKEDAETLIPGLPEELDLSEYQEDGYMFDEDFVIGYRIDGKIYSIIVKDASQVYCLARAILLEDN